MGLIEKFRNKRIFLDTAPLIYNYKTPDSIQLATAINYNSDYFLTNDKKLTHKDLKIITPDDLKDFL